MFIISITTLYIVASVKLICVNRNIFTEVDNTSLLGVKTSAHLDFMLSSYFVLSVIEIYIFSFSFRCR